jgi:ADP-ribose pyrophosphatase YjhB (NUDIX family)
MGDVQDQPSLGMGIAIIEDGKILLTKRRDFPVWCIPGGHLSPGESLVDAAIREAKEETGLDVELLNLVGVYSMPFKWENGSCEIILRACRISGDLIRSTNETIDAAFYSFEELPPDLIGWQYHQAVDALSDKVGVVTALNARLSLVQFRKVAFQLGDGDIEARLDWLNQVCMRPERLDLGPNKSS